MSDRAYTRIEISSDPRMLAGVRELVSLLSRRLGFDEMSASQIALAVDEALSNVICHGYCRQTGHPIWISLDETGDGQRPGLRVVIEDEGKQTACERIRSRDLDDVRPGGLGVHIIHEVMDEVEYTPREGGGMRLRMERVGNRPQAKSVCGAKDDGA